MKATPLVVAATIVLTTVAAQANTVSGQLWIVSEAAANNAIPANIPGTAPDVTFDVNSPFNFNAPYANRADWLASGSAFNITENTAGTLAGAMDDYNTGTLIEFTGFVTVYNGQTFTVTHDDGLTLIINGINLNFNPGPTAPITDTLTYNGVSGTFPFQLVYGECCSGAAVLQIDLPLSNSVPEGGLTLILLGSSLGLLGYVGRWFRK
jgi:hypothetical protein